MDRKVFASIMMAVSAAYDKFDMSEEKLSVYYATLGDLPAELLKAATLEHMTTNKWPPKIAELRQLAFEIVDRSQGRISAPEAWGVVMRDLRRPGSFGVYGGEPEFDDPTIAQAVQNVGGWRAICMTPQDVLGVMQARFLQAFERARGEERADQRALPQVRELVKRLSMGAERPALEGG